MDDDWGPDWRGGWEQQRDFYRKVWAQGTAGATVALDVLQDSQVRRFEVQSINRLDHLRLKSTF